MQADEKLILAKTLCSSFLRTTFICGYELGAVERVKADTGN